MLLITVLACMFISAIAIPVREDLQKPKRQILNPHHDLTESDTVQLIGLDHEHDQQLIKDQSGLDWRHEASDHHNHHQHQHQHQELVVEKKISYPVHKVPIPVSKTITIEKHVPVKVYKPIFIEKQVHVPHEVIVERRIPVLIERIIDPTTFERLNRSGNFSLGQSRTNRTNGNVTQETVEAVVTAVVNAIQNQNQNPGPPFGNGGGGGGFFQRNPFDFIGIPGISQQFGPVNDPRFGQGFDPRFSQGFGQGFDPRFNQGLDPRFGQGFDPRFGPIQFF